MNSHDIEQELARHLAFLQQDENNLSLLLKISTLYLELDDLSHAQHYLDKAKKIHSNACDALQGFIYLNQDQIEKAQEAFEKARTYEDSDELRYHLGFIYFMQQELSKAWDILSSIEDTDYIPITQVLMARILQQQEQFEQALALLETHVKGFPDNAEALGLLALLYLDMDEEDKALDFSQRALRLNPETYEAQVVDVMLRLVDQKANAEEIQQLLDVNPQDSRLLFALGSLYMTEGSFNLAIDSFEQTIAIHPDFYDCYIALGWCYLLNDDLANARKTYQKAVDLSNELADGWGGLALIHALEAQWESCDSLSKKALALSNDCFLIQVAQLIEINHKDPKKAQPHLLKILKDKNTPISQKLATLMNEFE